MKFYRGVGCPECFGSGYRGRIAVAESLVITKEISDAIHHGAPREVMMKAVEASGFQPISENARDLVLRGITTVDEMRHAIYTTD